MRTIWSVSPCCVLFLFIHVEAVLDGDVQSLLARLSVLEEKQAFFDKRIAALETENKLSKKRIAGLEQYKTLSDRRVAALERKFAFCNRRKYALAKHVAIEADKILPEKNVTTNAFDTSVSDKEVVILEKDKILVERTIAPLEIDIAVFSKRSAKNDRHTAAVEITNQPFSGLQSDNIIFVGSVAFSAMKAAHQNHIGLNQNILFDQVLTNEGDGYRQNNGVFTAPQAGVYVFSSTILTLLNRELHAVIVHNGNVVTRITSHGDSGRHDQGSQTVVIKMNAGDEVAVQNSEYPDESVYGAMYSSFSGYLI
ncbi:uncharacterized protein LOC127855545 [Dreissena polymorpha]|uniref:C1q domain-containing protein n=1 Tax=Dreissena polymorpha TaxID=45954 RepID=A0A9D4C200_DREPO|nr:uncharacterized protein LOC127855545 [Dreissena polymorpha]KAH3715704.1 hypothetical protein DPMN_058416 [Dreissena polymorpha]